MEAFGITVGPVDHTSLCIRFILAEERNRIADIEVIDPRGDIDIVGDQQGLACRELQDEALMPAPLVIIIQDADDRPVIRNQRTGDKDPGRACWRGNDRGAGRTFCPFLKKLSNRLFSL